MKKQKTRDIKAMLTNKVEGFMTISFPSLRCSPHAHAYRLKLSDWEISDLAKKHSRKTR